MLVDGDYKIDTSLDPFDLEAGQFRALRGGDWYIYSTGVQTTSHAYTSADNGNVGTGFRCVISQP